MALLMQAHLLFSPAVSILIAASPAFILSSLCSSFLQFSGLSGCFHFMHFCCLDHSCPSEFLKLQS